MRAVSGDMRAVVTYGRGGSDLWRSVRARAGARLHKVIDRAAHVVAAIGHGVVPLADPWRHGITLVRDVAYLKTGKRAHLLDIYRPQADGPLAAILYVHGGGFTMLSKDTHRIMALALASRGYVVFNINYRLTPRHRYPAPLEDACAALLWVLDHAAEHGADASRLVLAGESAGANLVTALAVIASDERPEAFAAAVHARAPQIRAVIAPYGIYDLVDVGRFWRDPRKARKLSWWTKGALRSVAENYAGGAEHEATTRAPLASPLRLISAEPGAGSRPLPPFFVAVGTRDPLLDDARRLRTALERRGVLCDLRVYPGEIHGFNALMWRTAAREKWNAVYRFLDEHVREGQPATERREVV